MKSPAIKLIPKLIALALSSSLMLACASQDGTEQKEKKSNTTTAGSELVSPEATGSQTVVATEETHMPAGSANTTTQINNEAAVANSATGQVVITEPEQRIFYFGFDKTDISQDDIDALMEHADFLKGNTAVVVAIDGHTDYRGPRSYNEHLSKKRAESVARVLIDAGVPESQLLINALADGKPMECKNDTLHNRRVELHYKDGNLASSK